MFFIFSGDVIHIILGKSTDHDFFPLLLVLVS